MLKRFFLIATLGLMFCFNVFATEIEEEISEDVQAEVLSEDLILENLDSEDSTFDEAESEDLSVDSTISNVQTIDIDKLAEEVNEYEIKDFVNSEENKFSSDENTLFGELIINSNIYNGTEPVSKNVYLYIFNYITQEMKYIDLDRNNNYSTELEIPYGKYIISAYIYDNMDLISMEKSSVTISETPCTINVNIKGVKKETLDKLIEDDLIEDPNETEEESIVNEVVEETIAEKATLGSILKDLLYNNLFTLLLVAGAVIALGIKRYRDNNNIE